MLEETRAVLRSRLRLGRNLVNRETFDLLVDIWFPQDDPRRQRALSDGRFEHSGGMVSVEPPIDAYMDPALGREPEIYLADILEEAENAAADAVCESSDQIRARLRPGENLLIGDDFLVIRPNRDALFAGEFWDGDKHVRVLPKRGVVANAA